MQVILFGIQTFDQAVTGTEEKDRHEESTGSYKRSQYFTILKDHFLRNMVKDNTDRGKSAKRLHDIQRSKIFVEILFAEFTGTAPEKEHKEKIVSGDTKDRPEIEHIF